MSMFVLVWVNIYDGVDVYVCLFMCVVVFKFTWVVSVSLCWHWCGCVCVFMHACQREEK